jgi:Transposase zinc-binding domain
VAFSCKGRGFCPSCTGRRMNATAANLVERVLPPESGLRQWVLTFPFSWRRRLAQDGGLLGRLTRIARETVLAFYAARAGSVWSDAWRDTFAGAACSGPLRTKARWTGRATPKGT